MAIYFNGTKINSFDFNGNKPDKVYFNNTLVYQSKNPLDNYLYMFPTGLYDWYDDVDGWSKDTDYRTNASDPNIRQQFVEHFANLAKLDFDNKIAFEPVEFERMVSDYADAVVDILKCFSLDDIYAYHVVALTNNADYAAGLGFRTIVDVFDTIYTEFVNREQLLLMIARHSIVNEYIIQLGFFRIPVRLSEDCFLFIDIGVDTIDNVMAMSLSFLRHDDYLNSGPYPQQIGLIGTYFANIQISMSSSTLILMGYNDDGVSLLNPRRY